MQPSRRYQFTPPAPVTPAAPGTTFAREAAGNASTFPTTAYRGFAPQSQVIAGTPADAGAALRSAAAAPASLAPLGTAYGASRIIPNAPGVAQSTTAAVPTPGGGSYQGFSYTDPATGKPAYGTASIPSAADAASQDSGIFVNGQASTHDAAGNLVAAASSGVNPAQKFAGDQAVIMAMYPQVGVAGSADNKKFVDAYNSGGQNKDSVLDLAKSLFGTPAQTASAVNPKDADAALIPAAIAKGQNVAANPPPSDAQQAGAQLRGSVTNAVGSVGSAYNSAVGKSADLVSGVLGLNGDQAGAVRSAAAGAATPFAGFGTLANGLASIASDPVGAGRNFGQSAAGVFNGFSNPTAAPPTPPPSEQPSLSPTGTPVAPAVNTLAAGAGAGGAYQGFAANAAGAAAIDPDELRRRQQQQQNNVASNS